MNDEQAPTREAWGDLASDLDMEFAFREFGGKTVEEAVLLFAENPIERAAELRFTPPAVFNYYVLAFAEAAAAASSQGLADLASCFVRLVRDRAVEQPTTLADVWPRIHPALLAVSERQSFYNADVDIYGSFIRLTHEAEEALREAEEDGA
jgi:hypothetical protein